MNGPFMLKGSLYSLINGAKAGHKEDARNLAKGIAELLRSDEPLPPAAKEYLVEALQAVADGEPGNKAFNTSGRRGVRKRIAMTPARFAAQYMQGLLESGEAQSRNDASQLAAEFMDYKVDDSTIRKAHRELFPSK